MKIGFIHNPNHPQLNEDYFSLQRYRFFTKALPAACEFVPISDNKVNMSEYDALIYNGLKIHDIPENIEYFGKECFKAAFCNDCHSIDPEFKLACQVHGINLLFYHFPEKAYRRYWKDGLEYLQVFMNLDPDIYKEVVPFEKRYAGKILNTGAVHNSEHYKLRIQLLGLTECIYVPRKQYFIGDSYPLLLQNYRATLATCTTTTVNKYLECMAAGCLTFCEANELNGWENLTLCDGVNCVLIDENNYQVKIKEYMDDLDNPKWAEIAETGRQHVLDNFSMYDEAKKLVEYIGGKV